ncbi:hypothetical protein C8R45DRAFT_968123 [Mycena sanguinolenta]|nr:hypothetical protein C8R45DRAFT_968123 [Mycena sanguinolenta]
MAAAMPLPDKPPGGLPFFAAGLLLLVGAFLRPNAPTIHPYYRYFDAQPDILPRVFENYAWDVLHLNRCVRRGTETRRPINSLTVPLVYFSCATSIVCSWYHAKRKCKAC